MRVSSLIGDSVIFIEPGATLLDVADALTTNDVGALAVGDGTRPVGVVSERDLVHAVAQRLAPEDTRAIDVAQTTLIWCDATATVASAASEMLDRYVRHMLVEANGRLVGIVSARDLLGAYVANDSNVESPYAG
jgi:CBS domain-containing protein